MLSITGWMVVNPWLLGMPSPPWIVTPPSGTAPPTPRAPAPCKDNIVYLFRFRELLVHLARGHLQGPRCSPHQGTNSWSSNTSRPELGRSLHVGHWVQHWGSDVGKALRNTRDNLWRATMTMVQSDWKSKNTTQGQYLEDEVDTLWQRSPAGRVDRSLLREVGIKLAAMKLLHIPAKV